VGIFRCGPTLSAALANPLFRLEFPKLLLISEIVCLICEALKRNPTRNQADECTARPRSLVRRHRFAIG